MPVSHESIPAHLYDCGKLFPPDLNCAYAGQSVTLGTRAWLAVSALTTSFVGGGSRIFMTSEETMLIIMA